MKFNRFTRAIAAIALTVIVVPGAAYSQDWQGFHATGLIGTSALNTDFYEGYFENNFGASGVGITGGLGLGADYVTGSTLIGVDTDISLLTGQATSFQNTGSYTGAANNWLGSNQANTLGTARLRVGHIINRDMIYLTGGLALANFNASEKWPTYGNTSYDSSSVGWQAGWTIGAGLEHEINSNLSARVEGLFAQFPDMTSTDSHGYVYRYQNNQVITIRAGLSYRF